MISSTPSRLVRQAAGELSSVKLSGFFLHERQSASEGGKGEGRRSLPAFAKMATAGRLRLEPPRAIMKVIAYYYKD